MSLHAPVAKIQPNSQPAIDRGPWCVAAVTRRAEADLRAIAEAMHARQRPPRDIELALARQAALWRVRGADLPDDAPLSAVRQLPGLATWNYLDGIDPDALADGIELPDQIEHERRRRAYVLADWLQRYAGTASAERKVRLCERDSADFLEGAQCS